MPESCSDADIEEVTRIEEEILCAEGTEVWKGERVLVNENEPAR